MPIILTPESIPLPFLQLTLKISIMNEIFRFHQIRPAQKISKEQKEKVGLPFYYNNSVSNFASELIEAGCDQEKIAELIKYFKASENYIHSLQQTNPIVSTLYNWLEYKAKPIKKAQLISYVKKSMPNAEFNLKSEWEKIGDSYLVNLLENAINSTNIDYGLLIKTVNIIAKFIPSREKNDKEKDSTESFLKNLEKGTSLDYINNFLDRQILLPDFIKLKECSDDEEGIYEFRNYKLGINANCECKCNEDCEDPSKHCISLKPYLADLFVIKEENHRYEEGDIAYIENILAGERKRREHRNLTTTEDYLESEQESIRSEEKDHQVSEQFSLQNEISKTVSSEVTFDAGVTVSAKYGPAVSLNSSANFSSNYSKSNSENRARSFAREVVDKSVTKVQEKVRTLQYQKVINELEEINLHRINNQNGNHRAGIYYWVNKISRAQVFNKGKFMMFDFNVPEPASVYRRLFELNENANQDLVEEPTKPDITIDNINRNTYANLLNEYSITGALPPPNNRVAVDVSFAQQVTETNDGKETQGFSKSVTVQIPEGYRSTSVDFHIRSSTGHPKGTAKKDEFAIMVSMGGRMLFFRNMNEFKDGSKNNQNWNSSQETFNINSLEGEVNLSLSGFSTLGAAIAGSVKVNCILKNEKLNDWKLKIYDLIMDDYNKKLLAYQSQSRVEQGIVKIQGRNPFLNRETERNELKRHITAALMCNYFNGMGAVHEKVKPCGFPEIRFKRWKKRAPIVQFFEQVVEWKHVTYLFYSSMWARKCKWVEYFEEDSGDPLFDKFLTAGAARVQVPIRQGMEDTFNYFLKTGEIWNGSDKPPIFGDDDYVSMIQELKESKNGDYSLREGEITAQDNSNILTLTNSSFYWDEINETQDTLNIENDINRELLIDFETYRVIGITQSDVNDPTTWVIELDRNFEGATGQTHLHSVGDLYVGAPWEINIPTKLVYLRNQESPLPTYPLNEVEVNEEILEL